MTLTRLVELLIRSLTVEADVDDVHRTQSSIPDHAALVVVARDGSRWRVDAAQDPWSRPTP